jgi:predicted ATPase
VNSSILPESLAKEFNEKNFKLPSFPYPSDFLKKKDDPLLNKPLFFPPWERISASVCFYDLSPKTAKNLIPISGKTELEEDGKNLALILNPILEDKDKKRKLINLLSDVLPFVNNIGTKKYAEKSLMITLKEKYFSEEELRADLLSDGTIEIITLLIILFFEEKSVVFIEEPERHLHPYLLSRLVSLMKDASKNKQIIVTTHSSEIVKHADIKDILLVSRSEEGNSEIKRPADNEQVKVFLKNELGLEDLFVQNLLDT